MTFVSANDGWLLGSATCSTGPCAAILRTTDGGRTWASIPAPATSIGPNDQGNVGVSTLRFADPLDGWAFGPQLWATHDGGATWKRLTLPGANATTQVMALEAGAGAVHAAFFDGSNPAIRIATSPVASDSWKVSALKVTLGAGPVPQTQIVLHGSSGWLVEVDRTVVGGARLVNGAWAAWQPPCLTLEGPAMLSAASDTSLVSACDVGLWATPTGVHLFTSTNAGGSFAQAATKIPVQDLQGVTAAPGSSAIVVAGRVSATGSGLVASFDLGKTWATVYGGSAASAAASISELGFTTTDQGVAIAGANDGTSQLLMTRDGGHTWAAVTITGS